MVVEMTDEQMVQLEYDRRGEMSPREWEDVWFGLTVCGSMLFWGVALVLCIHYLDGIWLYTAALSAMAGWGFFLRRACRAKLHAEQSTVRMPHLEGPGAGT